MSDPWRRFCAQPWSLIVPIAGTTTAIAAVAELLLLALARRSSGLAELSGLLAQPFFATLAHTAGWVGVGALGIVLCERWRPRLLPNTAILWTLVLCLLLAGWLKSVLLPGLLVVRAAPSLVGLVIGVFWKGAPYWRLRSHR